MSSANLIITGESSYSSGGWAYTGGSTNYTNLSDGSDSTFGLMSDEDAFRSFPITDTPSLLNVVTAVVINIRMAQKSDGSVDDFHSAQIFKSDGSTPITSAIGAAPLTGTITDYNLTPASILVTDKASWDGAVLKLLKNDQDEGGSSKGIRIYKVDVDITYSVADVYTGGVKKIKTVFIGC